MSGDFLVGEGFSSLSFVVAFLLSVYFLVQKKHDLPFGKLVVVCLSFMLEVVILWQLDVISLRFVALLSGMFFVALLGMVVIYLRFRNEVDTPEFFNDETVGQSSLPFLKKAYLLNVFETLGYSLEVYDRFGVLKWGNSCFSRVHGVEWDVFVREKEGRRITEFYDSKKVADKFDQCRRTLKAVSFSVELYNSIDEDTVEYNSVLYPIVSAERVVFYILLHRRKDKTQLKNETISHSEVVRKAHAMMKLTGGISHDFNNILAPIIGNCEIVLDALEPDHQFYSNISEALIASQRARTLVRQVLSYQQNYKQGASFINIADVLADSLKLFVSSLAPEIDLKVLRRVENIYVYANLSHLNQIFVNLFTIVQQTMDSQNGSMLVEQSLIHLDDSDVDLQNGVYVSITFLQSFEGISDERISIIEDRVKGLLNNNVDSDGLGLSLISAILEEYDGQIFVEKLGRTGFLYQVLMPVASSVSLSKRDLASINSGEERILIVDDEKQITTMLSQHLTRLGYHITACNDPVVAIELFQKAPHDFDLVLTDQTMPELTGDKLAESILAIAPNHKVLLMTGYSDLVTEDRLRKIGVRDLIYKPFDLAECEKLIRKTLNSQQLDLDELKNNLF